ncbi:MAG: alanine/ornithine racemase family PLP-dependent enzyme [Clostridia bacterium]
MVKYPRMNIDLQKLRSNAQLLIDLCLKTKATVGFVTKVFGGDSKLIEAIDDLDFAFYADSRLINLNRFKTNKPKLLIRLPSISEAKETVEVADISLNSEIATLKALNDESVKLGKKHSVVLMIDIGDLREGIFYKDTAAINEAIAYIINSKGLNLYGIGANLTCYGSIIPTVETMTKLVDEKKRIEKAFNIKIGILSGGNSSAIPMLFKGEMPEDVNNFRFGESLIRGVETVDGNKIDGAFDDVVTLTAEVIELKEKPSMPEGKRGKNAFGEVIEYVDEGIMKRAICAIGMQDIEVDGLTPIDKDIKIIGASSDHLLLNVNKIKDIAVGSKVMFYLNYAATMRAFTSEYVGRKYY